MPTIAESDEGASPWQQLLYAAKTDSVELAQTCLASGELDINKADGLGMTALHYAVKGPSPEVLELLLDDERLDVDPRNKLDGETPLHLAVRIEDAQARSWTVITLLDAGADPSIQNKHRDRAEELLPKDSPLHDDFRRAEADAAIEDSDVVKNDDGAESDGEEGGNSGEE